MLSGIFLYNHITKNYKFYRSFYGLSLIALNALFMLIKSLASAEIWKGEGWE